MQVIKLITILMLTVSVNAFCCNNPASEKQIKDFNNGVFVERFFCDKEPCLCRDEYIAQGFDIASADLVNEKGNLVLVKNEEKLNIIKNKKEAQLQEEENNKVVVVSLESKIKEDTATLSEIRKYLQIKDLL